MQESYVVLCCPSFSSLSSRRLGLSLPFAHLFKFCTTLIAIGLLSQKKINSYIENVVLLSFGLKKQLESIFRDKH